MRRRGDGLSIHNLRTSCPTRQEGRQATRHRHLRQWAQRLPLGADGEVVLKMFGRFDWSVALQSQGIGKTTWNGSQHGCEHLSTRISMPLASAHSKVLINRWRRPQKKCTCFFLEAAWSLIAFRMHPGMEAWMMSPCIMKWHMFIRKHFPMTALLWGHCHWGETQRCIHGADSPPNVEASVRWFTWFLNQISEPPRFPFTQIWNLPTVLFLPLFKLHAGNSGWYRGCPRDLTLEALPGEWTDGRRVRWLDEEPWELRWRGYGVAPYLRWGRSLWSLWIFEIMFDPVWGLVNLSRFIDQFRLF